MSVKGCSYNIYKTFRNSFALGADNFYASFIAVVVAGSRGLRDLPKVCGNSSHARTGALSARACVRAPFRAWRLVPGSVASFPEITRGCVPPCLPPSLARASSSSFTKREDIPSRKSGVNGPIFWEVRKQSGVGVAAA